MARKRRFIISNKLVKAHLCSFEQGVDGSIYLSFPGFDHSKWVYPDSSVKKLLPFDSPGKGKLSIHGSGLAHVKPIEVGAESKFRVFGSPLLSKDKNMTGIRHIATIFPQKPDFQPISQVEYENKIQPMVFVFFAVPIGLNLSFGGSFDIDEFEPIPPIQGFGYEVLKKHNIFWFSYSTKYMDSWPSNTLVHFSDGFICPIFVVIGKNKMRIEIRYPQYSIKDNTVQITI